MKKLPLVLIGFLVGMVLVSGLADVNRHPAGHEEQHGIMSDYSAYVKTEISDPQAPSTPDDHDVSRDEKVFLAGNIAKSSEMIERLESTVDSLEKEGNDVQELEQMVSEYASLVAESKAYFSKTETSSSSSDELEYLALSKDRIVQADMKLKDIFNMLHSYLPGPVKLSGNDTLILEGSGIVVLSGDLGIDLSLAEGEFSAVDLAGDMIIDAEELSSTGIISERILSDPLGNSHSMVSYNKANGTVLMSGSILNVAINGKDLFLTVEGTGEVELFGKGTYSIENGSGIIEGIWIPPVFETK
ncbi:hypothetical protein [Methanolobus sp. WCC4]|uniref:hypothetical protein n=1 Tax=Methanolobus sp. WCC4 TaxID=3125784 RepID=UPI0030F84C6B